MARDGERIADDAFYIDWNFGRGLNRICVEEHLGLCRNPSDFLEWLQHTGLVVRHHDRYQPGVWPQGSPHIVRVDQAAAVHWQESDFTSRFFQMLYRVQYRVVLDARTDCVIARRGETCN